jgi:uncharacterized membrane protein
MSFLIVVAGAVVGLVLGAAVGDGSSAALGFFGGVAFGVVFVQQRSLARRIDALRTDVARAAANARNDALRAPHGDIRASDVPPAESPPATAESPLAADIAARVDVDDSVATNVPPSPAAPAPRGVIDSAARRAALAASGAQRTSRADEVGASSTRSDSATTPGDASSPPTPASRADRTPPRDPFATTAAAVKRWFTEGNVPVKVGMLVLIAGFAALLKYATEQGWLHVPMELRLAGVALIAIGALAFGWRERIRRRGFALALQGGAIGVLLMTVFAAFRLYQLLPAILAFGLMLTIVAGTGVLAVLQDALALAVLAIIAGFAAPILISTGNGDHVVLFSYYALLNLAIFAIAWRKAWRMLNLLGFAFTYLVGTAWGVLRYEHALFSSTEPFLVIFFAIYLAIPILYAQRRGTDRRDAVDGTLVFGNPLIAFGLQAALLDGERMPLAYSALALAVVYAALAWPLIRRERLRILGESFAVLAVGFATLAVPLALSARATSCTFALEGAALVWLGFRQNRALPRWSGLALQALAAGAFVVAFDDRAIVDTVAIANGTCISALLIAGAAFVSAWQFLRHDARSRLAGILYLWGVAWWLAAGLREIDRFVPSHLVPHALLAFAAVSGAIAAGFFRVLRAAALAWTAATALAAGILVVFLFGSAGTQPFAGWGLVAFAAYAVFGFVALAQIREASRGAIRLAHAGWIWTWTLAFGLALSQVARDAALADGWIAATTLAPLVVAWIVALLRSAWIAPPLGLRFTEIRPVLLGSQAAIGAFAFAMLLLQNGDASPLPFVPLLNPTELTQIAIVLCAARWLADPSTSTGFRARRLAIIVAAGFAFITDATLRAVHHLAGAPWDDSIAQSMLAQTALTVVWSVLGVVGWVLGSRRGSRPLWLAGAVLMGIVFAKLLLVDRTHLGSALGIASFIAYGVLCTVIGYLAPAPPRTARGEGARP